MSKFFESPRLLIILTITIGIATGCRTVRPGAAGGGAFGTLAGGLAGASIGAKDGKSTEGALVGALAGGTLGSIAGGAIDREVERDRLDYANAVTQQRLSAVSIPQVIQMTENGLGSNVIISQINNQGVDRRPTIDDLIMMKNRGVGDDVIQAFQGGPLSGVTPIAARPAIVQEPVFVETFVPPPVYGFHYRRGCRPRRGVTLKF